MSDACETQHPAHGLLSRMSAGVDWFMPPHVRGSDPDLLHRARLVVTFAWVLIALAIVYAAPLFLMNSPIGAVMLMTAVGAALATLYVLRRTGSVFMAGNLLTAAFFGVLTALAFRMGGHGSLTLPWCAGVPVVALSTMGRRSAVFWLAVTSSSLAAFYVLDYRGYSFANDLAPHHYELLCLLAWIGLIVLILAFAFLYESFKDLMARRLRESEEKARAFIVTSRDWIWAIDLQGVHTYSNPALEAILGYRPDEVIGRPSLDLIHEDDRKIVEAKLADWIAKRRGWDHLQIRWKHKNGNYRYLESNAVPIVNTSGELLGFRGVDRDITERQQAEATLREAKEQAEGHARRAMEAMDEMERMHAVMMGREERVLEMKQEVNELLAELGQARKYEHV